MLCETESGETYAVFALNPRKDIVCKKTPEGWLSLGNGFNNDEVYAIAVYKGDIIVGGDLDGFIVKWNGKKWVPLGDGTNNVVSALIVHNDKLIVGGDFSNAGGKTANCIATWNGFVWSPLGSGMDGEVLSVVVYKD